MPHARCGEDAALLRDPDLLRVSAASRTAADREQARGGAMSMQYIRDYYKVPAKRGMRVIVDGEPGVITSARGCYLMVRFDGCSWSKTCHPTWRVEYGKREAGR